MQSLTDEELRNFTHVFKDRLLSQQLNNNNNISIASMTPEIHNSKNTTEQQALLQLLPEAFAVVREASSRVLGLRHYDVQLLGGIVLAHGSIAEMRTGEGKTLVAALPAYLYALTGHGVHVVTVNDYLAQRDKEWIGKVLEWLGIRVGVVTSQSNMQERILAFSQDVTYVTAYEVAFTYLRDNLAQSMGDVVRVCLFLISFFYMSI